MSLPGADRTGCGRRSHRTCLSGQRRVGEQDEAKRCLHCWTAAGAPAVTDRSLSAANVAGQLASANWSRRWGSAARSRASSRWRLLRTVSAGREPRGADEPAPLATARSAATVMAVMTPSRWWRAMIESTTARLSTLANPSPRAGGSKVSGVIVPAIRVLGRRARRGGADELVAVAARPVGVGRESRR